MSRTLTPGQIDDSNLSYYYKAEETSYGIYYRLIESGSSTPATFPKGFYASERKDDVRKMQQEEQIIVKSGGEAKKARGLTFHDDTVLLSQSIANNPNIGLVLSSGREA